MTAARDKVDFPEFFLLDKSTVVIRNVVHIAHKFMITQCRITIALAVLIRLL